MIDVQNVVSGDDSLVVFLDQLTRSGSKLFGEDEQVPCGLVFRRENGQTLLCSASPVVAEMYQVLDSIHALEKEPTAEVLGASDMQVTDDVNDPHHPRFFDMPASKGFASTLSIPLIVGPEVRAALTFYAHPAAFFSSDRQRVALAFAEQAAISVELRLRLAACQDLATNMRSAMESRTSIDMAIGIIIAQNRCSQNEASAILKRASNTRNVKLRDLAESMVVQASGGVPTTHFS